MTRTSLLLLLFFICLCCHAQENLLIVKKHGRTIRRYWKTGRITFQLQDGVWINGIIRKISSDSFFVSREVIRYSPMGSDTIHLQQLGFGLTDVHAVTTRAQLVNAGNGVEVIYGNEKFVWVRNGLLFKIAGAGYVGLNLINHLLNKDDPFERDNKKRLLIAVGLFAFGESLSLLHDPYITIGKKYRLETILIKDSRAKPVKVKRAF